MSMQGDPAATGMGSLPGTSEEIDGLMDGAADGADTELPDESDEAAGIADDGTGSIESEDAR